MNIVFDEEISDTVPATSDVEYPCHVCGREAGPYGGKGRKPTRCPEHKAQQAKTVAKRGANDAMAAQATEVLCQLNGFMALGAILVSYTDTAAAITDAEDDFRERTTAALKSSRSLCEKILKGGTKSGEIALLISYVLFGVAVLPTAINEHRDKRELKAAQEVEE